jgi:hypothetical protein
MQKIANELKTIIADTELNLKQMDSEEVVLKPYPDKWSKKEILGHLIDSAANNHQRFVRAQYGVADDFTGYNQIKWVEIQKYNDMDWDTLINLWKYYNLHLGRIIENISEESQSELCNIGKEEPVTLKYVVEDYIRHLKHHLEDVLTS